MKAYIYKAALYCESCALQIRGSILDSVAPYLRPLLRDTDSDTWPQGPYDSGGGESDSPQHCDSCGAFLENPLTPDGRAYVVAVLAGEGGAPGKVAETWRKFYGITDSEIWKASQ